MALSAAMNAYNDGVDALMVLMEAVVEDGTILDYLQFIEVQAMKGDGFDSTFGADTTTIFQGKGVKHRAKLTQSVASNADIPLKAGRLVLYHKLTNDLGEIL